MSPRRQPALPRYDCRRDGTSAAARVHYGAPRQHFDLPMPPPPPARRHARHDARAMLCACAAPFLCRVPFSVCCRHAAASRRHAARRRCAPPRRATPPRRLLLCRHAPALTPRLRRRRRAEAAAAILYAMPRRSLIAFDFATRYAPSRCRSAAAPMRAAPTPPTGCRTAEPPPPPDIDAKCATRTRPAPLDAPAR